MDALFVPIFKDDTTPMAALQKLIAMGRSAGLVKRGDSYDAISIDDIVLANAQSQTMVGLIAPQVVVSEMATTLLQSLAIDHDAVLVGMHNPSIVDVIAQAIRENLVVAATTGAEGLLVSKREAYLDIFRKAPKLCRCADVTHINHIYIHGVHPAQCPYGAQVICI